MIPLFLQVLLGAATLLFETAIAVVGSGLYAKCALFILVVQMCAIYFGMAALLLRSDVPVRWEGTNLDGTNATFEFLGPNWKTLQSNMYAIPDADYNGVFKVIFPAMTGIMAGSNMSGVLQRPELSIPRGELSAIFFCLSTYMVAVFAMGASIPRDTLQNDYLVLAHVAWVPTLVMVGVLASTTSSALASIQSAARVLQALAFDGPSMPHPSVLGSWGNTMRGAVRNQDRWKRVPCAYPRS